MPNSPCNTASGSVLLHDLEIEGDDRLYSLYDEFKGKTIVVTGGTRGIGKGCAEVFCDVGANVVICGRQESVGLATAQTLTEKYAGTCTFFQCNVGKESEVQALIEFAVNRFGRLDCIINNAGYYPAEKPIDDVTKKDVDDVFSVNFYSVFYGCKYALPHLRKTKGSIVNISSVESVTGMESAFCYTATKGAIDTFTRSLAIDETKHGVRVNALRPGNILTDMYYDNLSREPDPQEFEDYSNHVQWMGRGGQPIEIGRAALFLASSLASFVTGTTLLATGGYEIGEGAKYLRMPWNREE